MSLKVRELRFSYPGGAELYGGLSLEVEPGERVAVTAPSGAGKTTLCRLLAGYLEPTGGSVIVDGEKPRWRAGAPCPVQLLWQHPEQAFDPRMRMGASLAEGVGGRGSAGDTAGRRELDSLREAFGIRDEWASRLPHELSGGELMRFAMARALAAKPRYLIADEATAMLDAVTQAELWRTLVDLQERDGWGMVLVSHSPALVARVATRQVELTRR